MSLMKDGYKQQNDPIFWKNHKNKRILCIASSRSEATLYSRLLKEIVTSLQYPIWHILNCRNNSKIEIQKAINHKNKNICFNCMNAATSCITLFALPKIMIIFERVYWTSPEELIISKVTKMSNILRRKFTLSQSTDQ